MNSTATPTRIDNLALFLGAGFFVSLMVARITKSWSTLTLPIDQFISPDSVAALADEIDAQGGDFTLNAWQYVGADIDYSYYGSIIHFTDGYINCQKCLLPEAVVSVGIANCVGQAALLTSLLRNRISADKVFMVIGDYIKDGSIGGHAWVTIEQNGVWYTIESTKAPPMPNPWIPSLDVSDIYIADAWVNDLGIICYDPEICVFDAFISGCPCDVERR